MAELDRLDREHGLGTMPSSATARRRGRGRSPVIPGLLISGLLLGGVVALSPAENMRSLRRLAGFDNDRALAAPEVQDRGGSFRFSVTQRGSDEPVGYDPCRPIEVAVNPSGAPDDYEELVRTAMEHTSNATGLSFARVADTTDRDFRRVSFVSGTHRPVLVAWATPDEEPELAGDVAGIGGSTAQDSGTGRLRYVTGAVVLDRDVFADFPDDAEAEAQAIIDHEFGHLVGLAHVKDPGELMNATNEGQLHYGPGDLEGLARLGSLKCR
jgi:Matrixin